MKYEFLIDLFLCLVGVSGGKLKPLKQPKSGKKEYDEVYDLPYKLPFFILKTFGRFVRLILPAKLSYDDHKHQLQILHANL